MKKKMRVFQINGFRGIFLMLFIFSCLIAGFIAFPSFVMMNLWNYFAISTLAFPSIDFTGGVLLWGILGLSFYIANKKNLIVSFNPQQELTDREVNEIIAKIKAQTIKNEILTSKDFQQKKEFTSENKETKVEHKEN